MNKRLSKIDAALAFLRQHGMITLYGDIILCCSNCSVAAIDSEYRIEGYCAPKAYAFYHKQDLDGFMNQDKSLHIGYGCTENDVSMEFTTEVGYVVAEILRDFGLVVDWDGNPWERLKVA